MRKSTRVSIGVLAAILASGTVLGQEKEGQAPAQAIQTAGQAVPVTPIQKLIAYGNGPVPMVLIPDTGFNASVWMSFMERNGGRYSMVAVTFPGFDGTNPPELGPKEDWEAMRLSNNAVLAVVKMIEERGLDKPVVIGHGYGGHLAMRIALEHPDKVRSIVSIDGLPVAPLADPNQDDSLGARRLIVREGLAPKMGIISEQEWNGRHYSTAFTLVTDGHRANELAAMLASQDRGIYTFMMFEAMLSDLRPALKGLRVPMLCVAPVTPDPVPPAGVVHAAWYNNLGAPPGSWLTFYPNCRHFVMDDNPEQLDHDVALFVEGKDIPGAKRSTEPLPKDDEAGDKSRPLPDYSDALKRKEAEKERDVEQGKPASAP